ncbi:MAG: sugar phosphate isomerase/epimerase [Gemmatimonadetes bacterium]|nr:sugar phosphate isomerase/epimerase [Gemmatimonadota bacterium]
MREPWSRGELDRRAFLKGMAVMGGAVVAAGCSGGTMMQAGGLASAVPLRDRMGIGLYTVRDLTPTDYEGTLARLRQIGFKEVEPTGYETYSPQQFRAMLDRVGLTAPSTHASLVLGPNLQEQLTGYQIMGHRYARASGQPAPAPGAAPAAGQATRPAPTVDTWKRTATVYNQIGQAAKPYGIKVLIHNHTAEFGPIAGSNLRPIDVLLTETDPEVVVFELDIGWSSVAGQDALAMFRQHPGRFPLWHVKDVAGLGSMTPQQTMAERQRAAKMAIVGEGEINWKQIFDQARLAGLQHYFLEIEGEAVANGSLAAAQTSYTNLRRIIS